jgi:dTDP-4-dehydrorhamnose 3,5-epimerase
MPDDTPTSTDHDVTASAPKLSFLPTRLHEVIEIAPAVYRDARGFFLETYNAQAYAKGGIDATFVQDNHSLSVRGTVRGIHAQLTRPQGKLVRVIEGEILDVAVDIRRGSPTFGEWVSVRLSAEDCHQVWVPPNFAHGFAVLSETAQVEYKVTDFWDPADEITIAWNDPGIGVEWEIDAPILSAKDQGCKTLAELDAILPSYEAPDA